MNRREFCECAAGAVSLALVGSVVPACGGGPASPSSNAPSLPVVSGSVSAGAVIVSVDSSSPLATVGGAALVQSGAGSFLVARTGQNAFTALTATCTHQGCTVSGFQNSIYVCPCHGSEFSTSGAVIMGPAQLPLRQFPTQFSGSTLTITT